MFEYKLIKINNSALPGLGKDGWELTSIYEGVMYFKKKHTKTNNKTIGEKNGQWLEFISKYKTLKDSGLSDNALIVKYNKLCKEGLHTSIMNNLDDYARHLKAHKKEQFCLMAQTYINQERYKDNWEVVKVNFVTKWRSDMIKEQKIPEMYIEGIELESKGRDSKHGETREMTSGTFQQIIDKYYKK